MNELVDRLRAGIDQLWAVLPALVVATVILLVGYFVAKQIERWVDPELAYPDCSVGCRHFVKLKGPLGADWGVCSNPSAPRFGLLTFEHQAGFGCFVADNTQPACMTGPEWTESKP